MITFTLVAILGVLLVIVLMQLFKKDPKPLPAPVRAGRGSGQPEGHRRAHRRCSLDCGRGRPHDRPGFHRGPRHPLEAGARTWVELSGLIWSGGSSLRVGGDEEVEVFLHSDPRRSRSKISA